MSLVPHLSRNRFYQVLVRGRTPNSSNSKQCAISTTIVPVHRVTAKAVAGRYDILRIDNVVGEQHSTHDTLHGDHDDLFKLNKTRWQWTLYSSTPFYLCRCSARVATCPPSLSADGMHRTVPYHGTLYLCNS